MSRPLGVSVAKNLSPVGYRKDDDLGVSESRGWDRGECSGGGYANGAEIPRQRLGMTW